jgi:hypothetical protein
MVREELRQRVRAALAALGPPDREILVLRHLEQLAMKEGNSGFRVDEAGKELGLRPRPRDFLRYGRANEWGREEDGPGGVAAGTVRAIHPP